MSDNDKNDRGGLSAALAAAFPRTIPILMGFLCLGMAYGIIMQSKGYGPFWSALFSAVGYCGSMQFVSITLLTVAFDPVQAFLMSLMVNARHLFYSLSMLVKYRGTGRLKAFLIFTLCDETFSVITGLDVPPGVDRAYYYFAISFYNYVYWIAGSALGGLLGSFIPWNTKGMDFALTALFVVLFVEQVKKPESRVFGVVGVLCTAASLFLFGADNLVIPAMIFILITLTLGRKRLWS